MIYYIINYNGQDIYTSPQVVSSVPIKYNNQLLTTITEPSQVVLRTKDTYFDGNIQIENVLLSTQDLCGIDNLIIKTSHLPNNLQEVEYIGNNGAKTNYINTGVIPTANTGAEMTIYFDTLPTGEDIFFGARNVAAYASGNNYALETNTNKTFLWCYKQSTSTATASNVVAASTKYVVSINKLNDGKFYYNDNLVSTVTGLSGAGYGIGIFHCTITGNTGSSYSYSTKRFYNVKLYESGILTHEYIPCYCKESMVGYKGTTASTVAANTIGMYDVFTNKFYINAGSTDFIKGPDVKYY